VAPKIEPRDDSTHYVNAKDLLSLSLLQARLIDLGMPLRLWRLLGNQSENACPRLLRYAKLR
jgi:hypothetical protein